MYRGDGIVVVVYIVANGFADVDDFGVDVDAADYPVVGDAGAFGVALDASIPGLSDLPKGGRPLARM